MKRIKPPLCIYCNSRPASAESERWPSVKLCGICIAHLTSYFIHQGWANGNPFFFEISIANPEGSGIYYAQNPDGSHRQFKVENPKTT